MQPSLDQTSTHQYIISFQRSGSKVWIKSFRKVWIGGLDRRSGSCVGTGLDPDLTFWAAAIWELPATSNRIYFLQNIFLKNMTWTFQVTFNPLKDRTNIDFFYWINKSSDIMLSPVFTRLFWVNLYTIPYAIGSMGMVYLHTLGFHHH